MKLLLEGRFFFQSTLIHLFLVFLILLVIFFSKSSVNEPKIEFRVIEAPGKLKQSSVMPLKSAPILKSKVKKKQVKKKIKGRKVFGVNRNSLTTSKKNAVDIKKGNTIAKEVDRKRLKKGDADALPIPEEEYLVTAMPRVIEEFRSPYPLNAKENAIEGKVIMEILVDEKGAVRKVTLIRGPGYGLNETAIESIKKFRFKPAFIGNRAVAVVIRYGINFVLED